MKRSVSVRAIGALGVTAVLLITGACSSGSDDEAKDDKKAGDTAEETTTTAMSDEDFVGQVDALSAAIDEAEGDLCAIVEVGQQSGPASSPSTPAQVESLINAQVSMLRALAAVEPVDETNAPVLTAYADKLLAAAEKAGFSVDFLSSDEFVALQSDASLSPAVAAYQERSQTECPQPDAPEDGAARGVDPATTAPSTIAVPES